MSKPELKPGGPVAPAHDREPGTAERVIMVLKACRDNGLDEVIGLEIAGLLLTEKRRRQVQWQIVRQMHELLDNPVHRLLPQGSGNTAEDLRRVLQERVTEWLNLLESK